MILVIGAPGSGANHIAQYLTLYGVKMRYEARRVNDVLFRALSNPELPKYEQLTSVRPIVYRAIKNYLTQFNGGMWLFEDVRNCLTLKATYQYFKNPKCICITRPFSECVSELSSDVPYAVRLGYVTEYHNRLMDFLNVSAVPRFVYEYETCDIQTHIVKMRNLLSFIGLKK